MTMHEQVTVKVTEGHLERLLINNKWRDHGSPEDLANAISTVIKEQLTRPIDPLEPRISRPINMNITRLQKFMEMHKEWHEQALQENKRIHSRDLALKRPNYEHSEQHHVEIHFKKGEFDKILIDPNWARKAPVQQLATTILQEFEGINLTEHQQYSLESERLRSLNQKIREYSEQGE